MRIGPLLDDDVHDISEILGASFAYPPIETPPWLDQGGRENVRVLRVDERPVACLLEVPMGHFVLGRSVPTCGIAGVGVALDQRRRGHARTLMREVIEEVAARRCALSTLYPATQTLYRRAGYERAGKLVEVHIPMEGLRASSIDPGRHLTVRALQATDIPAIQAAYTEVARDKNGSKTARGFGFFAQDGALAGYLFMIQERPQPHEPWHDVRLTDFIARTPAALGAMVRFLYDQRSMARELVVRGGPAEALLMALDEPVFRETSERDWMVRVAHVESALAARGYPPHLRATVRLDLTDDLVADNRGAFTLEVEGGRGRVERGGTGGARLDVLALAPLFMGYLGACNLRRLGRLDANDAVTATLDAVFCSATPSMGEMGSRSGDRRRGP